MLKSKLMPAAMLSAVHVISGATLMRNGYSQAVRAAFVAFDKSKEETEND